MAEFVSGAPSVNSETPQLPYRWGYFQGALLIPFSSVLVLGVVGEQMQPSHEPWFVAVMLILICMVGLPLGIGLLMKKRFALPLVYVICGLTFLLTCVKVPYAVMHFSNQGGGSAFFEAELLLVWLFSFVYYRKRRSMFH
jgi:hypothetical protein